MAQLSWPFPTLPDAPPGAPPEGLAQTAEYARCRDHHATHGYATLGQIFALAASGDPGQITARARQYAGLFNWGATAQRAIARAALLGDDDAATVQGWAAATGLDHLPARPIAEPQALSLLRQLEADPAGYMQRPKATYPCMEDSGFGWGFERGWILRRLATGRSRMAAFAAGRRGGVAVLAGNGPSLLKVDPATLTGTDVYLSNYAIRDPGWLRVARGVAVTNRLVAAQEPALFGLSPLWRFHPVWLGHELTDGPRTIWLNAVGGPLFFSPDLHSHVAWHATVSYFWLQILFHAGYRRVVMIGFDHSYLQPPGMTEGTIIHQTTDDPNHFMASYFRGRLWQAADTDHMGRTYALARQVYEADGRALINATEGGALEVLPRMTLARALAL